MSGVYTISKEKQGDSENVESYEKKTSCKIVKTNWNDYMRFNE